MRLLVKRVKRRENQGEYERAPRTVEQKIDKHTILENKVDTPTWDTASSVLPTAQESDRREDTKACP